MRLVIVDDHPLFREGVALAFAHEPDIMIAGNGASAEDAVRLASLASPDILLLDSDLPDGLIALQAIAMLPAAAQIVVLTASANKAEMLAALRAGAKGYVEKAISAQRLVTIVRAIYDGQSYATPELGDYMLVRQPDAEPATGDDQRLEILTMREHEILAMVANGASNSQIAQELHVREHTVKRHMTHIMEKLQVHNRVEAAMLARCMPPECP